MNQNIRSYIESMKEKTQELNRKKAPVELVPDYKGPMPTAPSLGKFHHDAGGVAQSGKVTPYKGGKDAPDRNKGFGSDGLAYKGGKADPDMPKSAHSESPKEKASYPNIKTHEWLDANKKLNLAEFTKKIRGERLKGLSVNPSLAYESIKQTMSVCEQNQKYILDTVLEMKRNNVFDLFLATMMQQQEGIDLIAQLASTNESFNRKLNKSIYEYAINEGDEDEDEDDYEDEDDHDEDEDEDEDDHDEDEDDHDEDEDDHDEDEEEDD